jgi:hypothetical protein
MGITNENKKGTWPNSLSDLEALEAELSAQAAPISTESDEPKPPRRIMIEIGDLIVDASYIRIVKKIQRYFHTPFDCLRFGVSINPDINEHNPIKNKEVFFQSQEIRDNKVQSILAALEILGTPTL